MRSKQLREMAAVDGKQLLRSRRLPPANGQAVWCKTVDITLDELARLANVWASVPTQHQFYTSLRGFINIFGSVWKPYTRA